MVSLWHTNGKAIMWISYIQVQSLHLVFTCLLGSPTCTQQESKSGITRRQTNLVRNVTAVGTVTAHVTVIGL